MQVKSFLVLFLVLSLNLVACKNQDPGGTTTVSTPKLVERGEID